MAPGIAVELALGIDDVLVNFARDSVRRSAAVWQGVVGAGVCDVDDCCFAVVVGDAVVVVAVVVAAPAAGV